jgi:type IV secretion system protein VirB8
VIRYRFSGEPMTREDRFVNPLGFQVLHYRRDAEALPDPEATAVPTPGTTVVPGTTSGTTPGAISGGATVAPAPNFQAPQRAPARPGAPEVEL